MISKKYLCWWILVGILSFLNASNIVAVKCHPKKILDKNNILPAQKVINRILHNLQCLVSPMSIFHQPPGICFIIHLGATHKLRQYFGGCGVSNVEAKFVYYIKVTFCHQCSKMQIIPINNLTFKLVFSNFVGFSDWNVDIKVR